MNGLLLRGLPVPDADRLVTLTVGNTEQRFTYVAFDELRRHDHLFDGALAWAESALTIGEEAEPAYVQWVSGDFFDTLGVRAFAGRTLTPADDVAGGGPDGPVAVISHGLWQRRFGGTSDVTGRSLLVEGVAVTVVGVAPPGFHGVLVGSAFDLLLPVRINDMMRPCGRRPRRRPSRARSGTDWRGRWRRYPGWPRRTTAYCLAGWLLPVGSESRWRERARAGSRRQRPDQGNDGWRQPADIPPCMQVRAHWRRGETLLGSTSTQRCGRSQKRRLRRRREFKTTEIDDAVIAKAANMGLIRMPKKGKSNPAATGTPEAL